MPLFLGIWIVLLAVVISLMLGHLFVIFNFMLNFIVVSYILIWIRKDNKKYGIDWFWGRTDTKKMDDEEKGDTDEKIPEGENYHLGH